MPIFTKDPKVCSTCIVVTFIRHGIDKKVPPYHVLLVINSYSIGENEHKF